MPEGTNVTLEVVQDAGEPALPPGQVVSMQTAGALINQVHPVPAPGNPIPEGMGPALGAVQVAQQPAPAQGPIGPQAQPAPTPVPVPAADEPVVAGNQNNLPLRLLSSLYGLPGIGFAENDDA
jgi:hypothetical protein